VVPEIFLGNSDGGVLGQLEGQMVSSGGHWDPGWDMVLGKKLENGDVCVHHSCMMEKIHEEGVVDVFCHFLSLVCHQQRQHLDWNA